MCVFLQDDSTGEMIFDEVFHALSRCLAGLAQPFQVPGTDQLFRPKIFVTILAYSSIIGLASYQVRCLSLMGYMKETTECETLAMDLQRHHVTSHITTLGWGRPCQVCCLNVDPPSTEGQCSEGRWFHSHCFQVVWRPFGGLNHCGTAQRGHSLREGGGY